jgi:glucose-6-phosphate isomerase
MLSVFALFCVSDFLTCALCLNQIEMIYKIIQHMAANDRALIAEGSCGSPRSVKVYLGECNVDDL